MSFIPKLFGGGDKAPPPPPPPLPTPPPPTPPTMADASRQLASRNAGAAAAYGDTIKTGPQGLTDQVSTTRKSLLGG